MADKNYQEQEGPSTSLPGSSFDPPLPPEPSLLETTAFVAGGVGLCALDFATGGILSGIGMLPGWDCDAQPIDLQALERAIPGLAETSAPRLTEDHGALCTGCSSAVPFASMSLSEHGYFCRTCVGQL